MTSINQFPKDSFSHHLQTKPDRARHNTNILMEKMEFIFLVLIVSTILIFKCVIGQERMYRWKRSNLLAFNDPQYSKQFYLNDKFGVTMNIKKAWSKGYTGKNVTICINDPTGIYYQHEEFTNRFIMAASYNFDKNVSAPSPYGIQDHGTMMAGVAAAQANNGKCGVGVAYDAYISGMNIHVNQGRSEAKIFAASLLYGNQINDIYSNSWGPADDFHSKVGYMEPEVKAAVKQGSQEGRGGKGNIYVFANGNDGGGFMNGTCGYDEYVSSIYTISISVVTGKNVMSRQNLKCTGVSAVTYSRDGSLGVDYPHDLMPTCGTRNNECVRTTAASSAAAAVGSGILALVLQANPNLGWRDVQHLIARSSSSGFPSVLWKTNNAGIRVSDGFGFGLLDADALIENAKDWTNVGPQLECAVEYKVHEKIHGVNTTIKSVDLTTWPSNCGGESQRINSLEHVLLVVSFNYTMRKLVEIEIEAPTGTKSVILRSGRKFDSYNNDEVKYFTILSLHHWGENPKGIWTMRFRNVKPNSTNSGYLFHWGLRFYGTKDDPLASNTIKPSQIRANFVNTTSKPTASPRNTASHHSSNTTPTDSGLWTKPKVIINGTTGPTRKAPTTIKRGNGSVSRSCKSTCLAAILVLSLLWMMSC